MNPTTSQKPVPVPAARQKTYALVTVAVAVVAALVLLEGVLRLVTHYPTPEETRHDSLEYLPSIFARHRLEPDQEVRVEVERRDGASAGKAERVFHIGSRGYRGPEFAVPKPQGVRRIVILGGSDVFDIHATEGRDWPRLAEARLKSLGHGEAEVINAGIPGHASFDALGRLYSQVWTWGLDYVLLCAGWNDIKHLDDVTSEKPLIDLFSPYQPERDPFRNYVGPLDRVLCHSQLYVALRKRYFRWAIRAGEEGMRPADGPLRGDDSLGLRQYRIVLELCVDAARNIGATPILLTQPTLVSTSNNDEDKSHIRYEYQRMSHEQLVKAFKDCNDVVRLVAREKGAPLLDLDRLLTGQSGMFEDHVHTTARGSEALGAAVGDFLAETLSRRPG